MNASGPSIPEGKLADSTSFQPTSRSGVRAPLASPMLSHLSSPTIFDSSPHIFASGHATLLENLVDIAFPSDDTRPDSFPFATHDRNSPLDTGANE